MRKLVAFATAVVLLAVVYVAVFRRPETPAVPQTTAPQQTRDGYADSGACATCHEEIARTYALTGMARSFSRARTDSPFPPRNRLYHEASDRHYTMLVRDGRVLQRRHEVGFDGGETNVFEAAADYVIGSGNHSQTFLHRTADGRLLQLPVSWYAPGYWAMSPGYDRATHMDFRRLINDECMACHNGYPRGGVVDEGNGPRFTGTLREGIDCQRCHGPGQAHIDAIKAGNTDAARQAIVNPAMLDRARQLDTCMQCHLETTSSPLPFQIRRYEHPPFSYTPGKPLGDFFIHFDHAPGTGRDDKFEIAGGAYRLRKSACFQRSEMTCSTCHDPHDIPRGEAAVKHYVSVCQTCHPRAHPAGTPPARSGTSTCLDCHMPKRRAEDAVHVVITDHFIQRRRPSGDLLAPRTETDNFDASGYRGEVVLYYPPSLPDSPNNALSLALAQVLQGSNLAAGIPRLEAAIRTYAPQRPEFYYELARAYGRKADQEAVIRWTDEALRRDPGFAPALKARASAALQLGRLPDAAQALEKAAALRPNDAYAFADLGNVYLQQNRLDAAVRALNQALAVDPMLPVPNNTMGLALLKNGDVPGAERHFREAVRMQPDLAEARNNLGNLLAGRQAYAEAAHQFERALRVDPRYVEARRSYGLVLALTHQYDKAVKELQEAVRLAPQLAEARTDLGDVLAAMGKLAEAARQYEAALRLDANEPGARAGLAQLRGAGAARGNTP